MAEPENSKATLDEITKLIQDYVDYAQRELVHSEGAYHSRDGKVTRSSTIGAKRGDIDIEITVSVTCKQIATREI
jgi:hypothetical protein